MPPNLDLAYRDAFPEEAISLLKTEGIELSRRQLCFLYENRRRGWEAIPRK
jgi:hypothetical protein